MEIIPRAEWGARYPNGGGPAPLPATECWEHHSATTAPPAGASFEQDAAAIRALEQIGQDRFGQGISYTWIIAPSGRIFEGHGVDRLGAHTAGRNSRARAICLLGNYEVNHPTPAQVRAAAWLLQHAYTRRWLDRPALDGGHRDVKATACPGRFAYALIGQINTSAAGPPITDGGFLMALSDAQQQQVYDVIAAAYVRTGRGLGDLLADLAEDYLPGVAGVRPAGPMALMIDHIRAGVVGLSELRDDEATIIAAVREIVAADQNNEVVLTPEQITAFADQVLATLPTSVRDAVREAFARAGAGAD